MDFIDQHIKDCPDCFLFCREYREFFLERTLRPEDYLDKDEKSKKSVKTMPKILPYHTTLVEYPPSHREVYHDNDECPYGKEIKAGHRHPGTGNKLRCKVCINLQDKME